MSKNERKWSRMTPEAMSKIAEELSRTAARIDHASRLLETAAAAAEFDLSDVERKPPGEDGGDRGG